MVAPPCYTQRVSKERMAQEVMVETHNALKELMDSHPQLFSGQPATPTKVSYFLFISKSKEINRDQVDNLEVIPDEEEPRLITFFTFFRFSFLRLLFALFLRLAIQFGDANRTRQNLFFRFCLNSAFRNHAQGLRCLFAEQVEAGHTVRRKEQNNIEHSFFEHKTF